MASQNYHVVQFLKVIESSGESWRLVPARIEPSNAGRCSPFAPAKQEIWYVVLDYSTLMVLLGVCYAFKGGDMQQPTTHSVTMN